MSKKFSGRSEMPVDKSTGEVLPPRIKTWMQADLFPKVHEKNNEPSKTVPGLSMTILEMVKRHRQGLPIDESKGALYQGGEEPLPDLSKMDLVDRAAYMDSVADALVEVKSRLAATAKSKAEKEFLDKVDAAVREKLSKLSDSKVTDITPEE